MKPGEVILADGTSVPYGTLIWTTGIAPRKVIQNSPFLKVFSHFDHIVILCTNIDYYFNRKEEESLSMNS